MALVQESESRLVIEASARPQMIFGIVFAAMGLVLAVVLAASDEAPTVGAVVPVIFSLAGVLVAVLATSQKTVLDTVGDSSVIVGRPLLGTSETAVFDDAEVVSITHTLDRALKQTSSSTNSKRSSRDRVQTSVKLDAAITADLAGGESLVLADTRNGFSRKANSSMLDAAASTQPLASEVQQIAEFLDVELRFAEGSRVYEREHRRDRRGGPR